MQTEKFSGTSSCTDPFMLTNSTFQKWMAMLVPRQYTLAKEMA